MLGLFGDFLWGSVPSANQTTSVLTYKIYAVDENAIAGVIKQLDYICKNESARHVFDSTEEQEAIRNMNDDHVCWLCHL